jgi:CMP-N,N'-diacetyllegionaminic acid synthase
MKLLAIIPARGGSKGIPDKNIIDLCGKPLITYSIEAAKSSASVSNIIVTSDDDRILKIGTELGVQVLKRPSELATDTASSDDVIRHVLETSCSQHEFTHFILLQPTSPLRTHGDIDNAWKMYKEKKPELLISTFKPDVEIQKAFVKGEDGFLTGLLSADAPFQRRQDLPDIFLPNGAIYICSVADFMAKRCLPRKTIMSFEMTRDNSIDIDTINDLEDAKKILSCK